MCPIRYHNVFIHLLILSIVMARNFIKLSFGPLYRFSLLFPDATAMDEGVFVDMKASAPASHVAARAGKMPQQTNHRILGVVENMSYFEDATGEKHCCRLVSHEERQVSLHLPFCCPGSYDSSKKATISSSMVSFSSPKH